MMKWNNPISIFPFYHVHIEFPCLSNLISMIFGDKGKHTRAAVSVNSLPLGAAVEIEGIFEI